MGYVYLIEDVNNKTYKIGVTRDKSEKRLKKLQTGNSTELTIKYLYETEYPFRLESMLHTKYKEYNVLNEWFDLPQEDINNFLNTCSVLNNTIISLKDNPYFSKNLK